MLDLATLSTVLLPALGALGLIGTYMSRQSRSDRAQLRKARRWMQEADIHMYQLESLGWSRRGLRPPPRPTILEIRHDDTADPDVDQAGPDPEGADERSRRGARHSLREG